jgi:hypothetical protein
VKAFLKHCGEKRMSDYNGSILIVVDAINVINGA